MKSKNLVFFLVISIFIIGCMAPTKKSEVAKPGEEKAEAQQQTESKEIVEGVDQYEPNNRKEKAAEIKVDSEIKGTIYRRGDRDFYKFTVDATEIKNFSVEMVNPGGRIEPVMAVYEPDGEVHRVRPVKRGANLTAEITAKSGDYYVEISDQERGQSTKPYVLKVITEKREKGEKPSEDVDFTID